MRTPGDSRHHLRTKYRHKTYPHGVQPSLRSIPAPHLYKAGGPGRRDAGPHETLSLAQTAKARAWSCRGGGARLGVPPCWGILRGEAAGSDAGSPAGPGEKRYHAPGPPGCRTPPHRVCHDEPSAASGEGKGKGPEALLPAKARERPCPHPSGLLPGTLGCVSRVRGGRSRESRRRKGSRIQKRYRLPLTP